MRTNRGHAAEAALETFSHAIEAAARLRELTSVGAELPPEVIMRANRMAKRIDTAVEKMVRDILKARAAARPLQAARP